MAALPHSQRRKGRLPGRGRLKGVNGSGLPARPGGRATERIDKEAGTRNPKGSEDPRLLAVAGGKGGVGKTFIAANLATSMAQIGQRVVAIDADLEGANLHTCLGVPPPREGLADFVANREEDLRKLALETPIPNLRLVAGTHGHLSDAQPDEVHRVRLIRSLRQLDADWVILDLGPGLQSATLDYFLVADAGLLVINPEPGSVENAYAFLRAAFYRRLRQAVVSEGLRDLITEAMDPRNEEGIRTPHELRAEVESADPAEGARFVRAMAEFHPRIVINGVRNTEDIRLGFAVASVCRRYFGVEVEYLGYVNHDEAARRSVLAREPVVRFAKEADAAIYLDRIARKICGPPPAVRTESSP